MTEKNDNSRSLADILELGSRQAESAGGTPRTSKRPPVCAGVSVALPVSGILLTFILVSASGGTGDFACFAPAIIAGLVAFPLGFIGVALGVTAIVRREKWVALAVIGIVLNLVLMLLSAPLVWTVLQR